MFKNLFIGFVSLSVLVSVSMASNVQAKLVRVLTGQSAQPVKLASRLPVMDCEAGAQALGKVGFSRVFATDCTGTQFSYNGFRGTSEYTIVFNAQSAGFTAVSR